MIQQDFSFNLAAVIARIKNAGIDWDGENIADLLWLANYVDAPEAVTVEIPEDEVEDGNEDMVEIEIDNTPPAPEFSLYSQTSQQTQTKKGKGPQKGIPFQTPTAPALRKTLELGRSLRPLMRRIDSYTQTVLDEEATAEQTAERQFCMTMVQPARERWVELALVIEDSASSFLWRDTMRDFQQVLERQGAFRTVSVWYLQTSASGAMALYAKRPIPETMPRPRDPKGLVDASGRRLIVVVSDCISPAWAQGRLQTDYLELWAKHGPVAILQMLPSRMWCRTALEEGLQTTFSARGPGGANTQLVDPLPKEFHGEYGPGLKLPIITLEPSSMAQWARVLAGFGDTQTAGIWYPLEELVDDLADEPELEAAVVTQNGPDYAEQLVNQFSQTASQTARELASLMALVPVELPLVYIIQAKLLPESSPLHVAEVFLSGLIERVKPETAEHLPTQGSLFDQQRHYRFVDGVRELLIDTVRKDSAEEVLNEVSTYIGSKLGKSIYSFMALLRLKDDLETTGSEFVEFASVTKQALRRFGDQYAELVEAVETEGDTLSSTNAVQRYPEPEDQTVDVLIITAAPGEQEALLKCRDSNNKSQKEAVKQWKRVHFDNDTYYYRYLTDKNGNSIKIASVSTLDQGENQAAAYVRKLAKLKPKCIAVIGICAGDQKQLHLGDVIVAERLFRDGMDDDVISYKILRDWARKIKNYERVNNYLDWQSGIDLERPISYERQSNWLLYALLIHESKPKQNPHPEVHPDRERECPNYRETITFLLEEGLISWQQGVSLTLTPAGRARIQEELARDNIANILNREPSNPQVFLRPVRTGTNLIDDDNFFSQLKETQRQSYAVAYDMEGYTIAEAAWAADISKMIFVKSVSDFGGAKRRNRHFRAYACSVSATFLVHFVKNHFFD